MPWIRTLAVIFTLFSTAALAHPVIKDGKEWLQPADFVNLSWNEVAGVCDPDTGLCDGELNNVDVTGYTWASVDEVNGLFNAYGVTPPLTAADEHLEAGSSWAPLALGDFDPTYLYPQDVRFTAGWTRVLYLGTNAFIAYVKDAHGDEFVDTVNSGTPFDPNVKGTDVGVWLYYDHAVAAPATVPTVSTYVLIFTVLGLLVIANRRLSRRNAREG
ncbi:MAG: hypothetical protein GY701_12410 [Sulfitobacter sp.]|nr:hypothetical protein [Sulfitobacter sp.]